VTRRPAARGRPARGPSPWRAIAAGLACSVALTGAAPTPGPSPSPDTAGGPIPATTASPAPRASYGARPAHHGDPDLPVGSYLHTLEPGTSVDDGVEILNLTDDGAVFLVYATDLVPVAGGTVAAAARDAEVTGPGGWIVFDDERAYVPPRSAVVAPFELAVPVGTAPGSYRAAVLVERDVDEGRGTITSRTRIALWVDIEVLGPIDLGAVLGPLAWARTDDGLRFTMTVENTGSVTFVAGGDVHVSGTLRDTVVPFGPVVDVVPERTVELTTVWSDPPWLGRVVALPIVEATVEGRPPRDVVGDEVAFWLVPWRDLAVIAGAVLALALLWWATRDARGRWRARRREERELVREHRARRRAGGSPPPVEPPRAPVGAGPGG
jgi:hypothetical protein